MEIDSYALKHQIVPSCGCIRYSSGERKIKQILEDNNIRFITQYGEPSLGSKKFDFAILKSDNTPIRLIEFDGKQHFEEVPVFKDSLKAIQKRDQEKNQWALERNIPLVRIPYWQRDNITIEMLMSNQYLIEQVR